MLIALALTVVHLALATGAHGGGVAPTGAPHAASHAQALAAPTPSSGEPHACGGCAGDHSAAGAGHLCVDVLGAVLLAAGARWVRGRTPTPSRVVAGSAAGPPLLLPVLVPDPPWTHPSLERLCVRRV